MNAPKGFPAIANGDESPSGKCFQDVAAACERWLAKHETQPPRTFLNRQHAEIREAEAKKKTK